MPPQEPTQIKAHLPVPQAGLFLPPDSYRDTKPTALLSLNSTEPAEVSKVHHPIISGFTNAGIFSNKWVEKT